MAKRNPVRVGCVGKEEEEDEKNNFFFTFKAVLPPVWGRPIVEATNN